MKIVFRTDASIKIGTGHVMRCLTLAKGLVEKGAKIQFICRDHSGNLIERIRQEGFEVYTLITENNGHSERSEESREPKHAHSEEYCHSALREESLKSKLTYTDEESPNPKLAHAEWLGVSQKQDANDCQPILEIINPDWLIVDHYAIDQAWQNDLKLYYQKLMVIDDLGDRNHLCDLLLDQNYGSTEAKYQSRVSAHCKVLAGAHYALLRPEFAQWRDASLKRRKQVQNIKTLLITLGGVDPDNYTAQILSELSKTQLNKDIEIMVVMGATAPHLVSVKNQAEVMPIKISVKTNVTNMAELMANADLAIGAAGATTWERCCLGLPSIQLVIAENQRQIAQSLAKDDVVKLIDQVEQLPGLVEAAKQWINYMSQQAAKVCDGLGCQRVVEQILTMEAIQAQNVGDVELLNFIELSESDVRYVLKMRNHPEIKKWMVNQEDITKAQHLSFIEALKTDNSKHYFLVKQAGMIIGSVNFTKIDQVDGAADLGLYANPFERITGAGKILDQAAISYSKNKLKLSVLNLEVFEENERAINFYNKIGFRMTGTRNLNDQVILCMQKAIKESE